MRNIYKQILKINLSAKAQKQLENHVWQGNIRELRNTLERNAALSPEDLLDEIYGLEAQRFTQNKSDGIGETSFKSLAELEKLHILKVLADVRGHREKAAVIFGITLRTLYRKITEYESEV